MKAIHVKGLTNGFFVSVGCGAGQSGQGFEFLLTNMDFNMKICSKDRCSPSAVAQLNDDSEIRGIC